MSIQVATYELSILQMEINYTSIKAEQTPFRCTLNIELTIESILKIYLHYI